RPPLSLFGTRPSGPSRGRILGQAVHTRTENTSSSARLMSAKSKNGVWKRGRHQECRGTMIYTTPFAPKVHALDYAILDHISKVAIAKVVLSTNGNCTTRQASRDWSRETRRGRAFSI